MSNFEREPQGQIVEPSVARAFTFEHRYVQGHPQSAKDEKLKGFFTDLTDGRFWAVMSRIDGDTDRAYTQTAGIPSKIVTEDDIARYRKSARDWANTNFTPEEQDEIFDIYLDQALHAPVGRIGGSAPGSQRGHSLAFEQLVENNHSKFADKVTPELKRELANGRFWEELHDAQVGLNGMYSLSAMQDLFTQHFDLLDPSFASKGFGILERRERDFRVTKEADLEYLSDEAIDNYLEFVRGIDDQRDDLGITKNQISGLMKRYIGVLLSPDTWDHDYSYRFGPHYNPDVDGEVTPEKGILVRFEDPLVQEYLQEPQIRKMLMEQIEGELEHGLGRDKEVIPQVVARIPNHHEFIADMAFAKLRENEAIKQLRTDVNQIEAAKIS